MLVMRAFRPVDGLLVIYRIQVELVQIAKGQTRDPKFLGMRWCVEV